MNIQIIVQNYPPERGPVRYTYNLARFLSQNNHDVTVVTGLPHYPTGKPYNGFGKYKSVISNEDGIRIIRTPLIMGSNRQKFRRILGFISFIFSALRWSLTEAKPDIIIASIPPATVSIIGWVTSLIRGAPFILVLRDIEPISSIQLRSISEGYISKCLIKFFLSIYKKAKSIVVIHKKQLDELVDRGLKKSTISVIPHVIDIEKFTFLSNRQIQFQLSGNGKWVKAIYVGTIGLSHDIELLIKLLSDSQIQKLPIDFHFIGGGERLNECKNVVNQQNLSNIYFYDPRPLEDIPSILKEADLLIVSYKNNPSTIIGSKILEYCASGKPVLVHGPESIRTFVDNIGNGLTCKNGDLDFLRSAIRNFIDNKESWKVNGLIGKSYIKSNFGRRIMEKKWIELLF